MSLARKVAPRWPRLSRELGCGRLHVPRLTSACLGGGGSCSWWGSGPLFPGGHAAPTTDELVRASHSAASSGSSVAGDPLLFRRPGERGSFVWLSEKRRHPFQRRRSDVPEPRAVSHRAWAGALVPDLCGRRARRACAQDAGPVPRGCHSLRPPWAAALLSQALKSQMAPRQAAEIRQRQKPKPQEVVTNPRNLDSPLLPPWPLFTERLHRGVWGSVRITFRRSFGRDSDEDGLGSPAGCGPEGLHVPLHPFLAGRTVPERDVCRPASREAEHHRKPVGRVRRQSCVCRFVVTAVQPWVSGHTCSRSQSDLYLQQIKCL